MPPTNHNNPTERAGLRLVTHTNVDTDDAAVVGDLRANRPGAARALWDKYQPLVRRILARSFGPQADVDDLVQEAFIRLHRSAPRMDNPTALRGLVYVVATRVIQQELRSRWVRRWVGLSDDGSVEMAGKAEDFEGRAAVIRFYCILDKLPTKTRTAFVLRHVEGLELTEVADAMDTSLSSIKRWLLHAGERVSLHAARDPLLASYLQAKRGGELHE